MDCCQSFAKYMLLIFNIFVWIAGGTILGLGIYLRVGGSIEDVVVVADIEVYYSGCYIMIAAGTLMFLIGFVGCCGAMTENKCLLGTYFFVLLVIFFLEVGVGIWAAVEHDEIDNLIMEGFNKTLSGGEDPNNATAQSVISMQRQFHCCGLITGCNDWNNSITYGCTCTDKTDPSCVPISNTSCTVGDKEGGAMIWNDDCYDSVVNYVENHIWVFVGVGLGIGFAEIIGMVFSMILCRMSTKSGYEGMYA